MSVPCQSQTHNRYILSHVNLFDLDRLISCCGARLCPVKKNVSAPSNVTQLCGTRKYTRCKHILYKLMRYPLKAVTLTVSALNLIATDMIPCKRISRKEKKSQFLYWSVERVGPRIIDTMKEVKSSATQV